MFRVLIGALMFMLAGLGSAMAQSQYRVQPGDTLQIEVLEDQSLNRQALVLPDGTISMPLVGTIKAKGLTLGQLQNSIASALAPNFASKPTVFVTVGALNAAAASGVSTGASVDVYIMGAVNNPGKYTVASGTTLLQFLAESGGFSKFAATKRIQLRRPNTKTGQTTIYTYNYKAVESGAASAAPIVLRKGDVIVVPERRLFE